MSTHILRSALLCLLWTAVRADYEDLRGRQFCAARPDPQCCQSRDDDCSVPIEGTKCYCDQFCDREVRGDCCFDYKSHCLQIPEPPEEIKQCYFEGQYRMAGERWDNNCNTCECKFMVDHMDVMCTRKECLIEENIIDDINRNERSRGWRAGRIETFWGHSLDEGFEKRLGTLYARKPVMNMLPKEIYVEEGSLPASFDAIEEWPNYVTPPQDQGWCANSWVWSTIGVASDRWGILSRGEYAGLLSGQHLFSCNSKNQKGCSGGYLTKAWNYILKFGLVTDECLPWTGDTPGRCSITKKPQAKFAKCPGSTRNDVLRRIGPLYRITGEEQIMKDIMEKGPVQATMRVYRDFFVYKGGVYKCPEKSRRLSNVPLKSQHSVRIIGWGETTEYGRREKYWIAANSWGREWGENGFFRIARGQDECNIESFVLAITVHSTPAVDPLRFHYNTTATSIIRR